MIFVFVLWIYINRHWWPACLIIKKEVFTLLHGAVSMSFQETNTKGIEEGNELQKQISELQKLAQLQL